eukprot:CAMPEP_0178463100 /NCGR_PEP_ID=MMETSP0689_2-20121128/50162_1 /TAXON_ID=160604 /ORGANISM="Amphidinium massartii, Strain CS-259" /LENGTH=718 /DNA_ID=CAMNT_0020089979 /DNA_START=66 /DNA_END=2219 /DNA_ORIENTATION=-
MAKGGRTKRTFGSNAGHEKRKREQSSDWEVWDDYYYAGATQKKAWQLKETEWPQPASTSAQREDTELLEEAVSWLYEEEVLPRAIVVQWRLGLMCGSKWSRARIIDAAKAVPELYLEPAEPVKLNFFVFREEDYHTHASSWFADDDESAAAVPETLWLEAVKEMEVGGWPMASEPAFQIFEVASWLQGQSERLRKASVGMLLGLARRGMKEKVLGYRGPSLVPYWQSDDHEKAENARLCQPTGIQEGEIYVKEWKHLKWCLAQVLAESENEIHPPALKMKFREKFSAELSETAFGHTTLMGLLRDERLGSDFIVEQPSSKENTFILKLMNRKLATAKFSGQGFGVMPAVEWKQLLKSTVSILDPLGSEEESGDSDSSPSSADSLELIKVEPVKHHSGGSPSVMMLDAAIVACVPTPQRQLFPIAESQPSGSEDGEEAQPIGPATLQWNGKSHVVHYDDGDDMLEGNDCSWGFEGVDVLHANVGTDVAYAPEPVEMQTRHHAATSSGWAMEDIGNQYAASPRHDFSDIMAPFQHLDITQKLELLNKMIQDDDVKQLRVVDDDGRCPVSQDHQSAPGPDQLTTLPETAVARTTSKKFKDKDCARMKRRAAARETGSGCLTYGENSSAQAEETNLPCHMGASVATVNDAQSLGGELAVDPSLQGRLCIRRTFLNIEYETDAHMTPTRAKSAPPHGWADLWPCMWSSANNSNMDTPTATLIM